MAAGGNPLIVYLMRGFVSLARSHRPWFSGTFFKDKSDRTDPGHYFLFSPPHHADQLREAYEAGQHHGCTFAEWQRQQEKEALQKQRKPLGIAKR